MHFTFVVLSFAIHNTPPSAPPSHRAAPHKTTHTVVCRRRDVNRQANPLSAVAFRNARRARNERRTRRREKRRRRIRDVISGPVDRRECGRSCERPLILDRLTLDHRTASRRHRHCCHSRSLLASPRERLTSSRQSRFRCIRRVLTWSPRVTLLIRDALDGGAIDNHGCGRLVTWDALYN